MVAENPFDWLLQDSVNLDASIPEILRTSSLISILASSPIPMEPFVGVIDARVALGGVVLSPPPEHPMIRVAVANMQKANKNLTIEFPDKLPINSKTAHCLTLKHLCGVIGQSRTFAALQCHVAGMRPTLETINDVGQA